MSVQAMSTFQKRLKSLMNEYVHYVYKMTSQFPKQELFGSVSQFRRAAMSVVLNYIEGFTRRRKKVQLNSYETSYGSLHESIYLFGFSLEENWISQEQYNCGTKLADEIGAMLWSEIENAERSIKKENNKIN